MLLNGILAGKRHMGYTFQHECPQCGGPFAMAEADHLVTCQFCNTNSYLHSDDLFHFVLPSKVEEDEHIYLPYLRCTGALYNCSPAAITHKLIDISQLGIGFAEMPPSLGLRPQAMKLKFASTIKRGRFIRASLHLNDIIGKIQGGRGVPGGKPPAYQAFIGESASIIYLPLSVNDGDIFDAVTGHRLTTLPQGYDVLAAIGENTPPRPADFLATICPQCGWNLDGETDSLILLCKNCHSAWQPKGNNFQQIKFQLAKGKLAAPLYLPFWKISATAGASAIDTFNDFIHITNQPLVSRREWDNKIMAYWAPAFKIRPKTFLRLTSQLTISQADFAGEDILPKDGLHPVTLPASEALQTLKLTLANCAINKKDILPQLADINFSIQDISLQFLPFSQAGYGLYNEELKININKQHLKFGRHL